jgi:hypothetical protein
MCPSRSGVQNNQKKLLVQSSSCPVATRQAVRGQQSLRKSQSGQVPRLGAWKPAQNAGFHTHTATAATAVLLAWKANSQIPAQNPIYHRRCILVNHPTGREPYRTST